MVTFAYAAEVTLREMEDELSPTAMPSYRSHAKKALAYWGAERDMETLSRREVQDWVNQRRRQVKPATVQHELAFLSRLWRVVEDGGSEVGCPVYRIRKPKLNNAREREIHQRELNLLEQHLSKENFQAVDFARHTFLRRLEQWRLTPADLKLWEDEENAGKLLGKLRVVTSKTGKGRVVYLNNQAAAIAAERALECERTGDRYLFGPQDANRESAAIAWSKRVWKPALRKLGIANAHWHDLRHLGATTAWRNGAKIEQIRVMLGHSSVKMTERYLRIDETQGWGAALAAGKGIPKERAFSQFDQQGQ